MGTQQFSLRWNNYLRHITSAFDSLRTDKDLVDVTLSCEGKKIKAHKMLLSACSSYFKDLFKDNPCQHPVVIFRNVKFEDLDALVNFMYQGEVNVLQEQLASFLTTAELLEVQGLTDGGTNPEEEEELETEIVPPPPVPQREFRPEKRRSQPQSSNETMSPVSFIPINKRPESPLTKRRKFLSSSSSMKPSEKDTESRRHAQQQQQQQQQLSSPDPVEVIPVVPNVKIEKPEYYESDQGGGEYSDSMHASNSNQEMTDMSEHGHLDSKQEAVDIYEDSGDSSHLEGLSDLSSILSKPGTSVESVSQESLHGHWLCGGKSESTAPELNLPRYDCTLCGASYKHLRNLRAHIHLHSGLTKCQLCNKVLCNRSYYRKHMKQQHGVYIKEEKGSDGPLTDDEANGKDFKSDMMTAVVTASSATVTISPASANIPSIITSNSLKEDATPSLPLRKEPETTFASLELH